MASKGWFCLKDLKEQFRLKPAAGQIAAGSVWQGQGAYKVYDKVLLWDENRVSSQQLLLRLLHRVAQPRATPTIGCKVSYQADYAPAWQQPRQRGTC